MWIIILIIGACLIFGAGSGGSNHKQHKKRPNSWESNDDLYRTEDDFNHYDEEHDTDENGYCPDCDEYEEDIDENT